MNPSTAAPSWLAVALRRAGPSLALLVGGSCLLLVTDRAGATRRVPAIGILQHTSSTVLDDAVRGMVDALAERGWRDGATCTIRRYNAEGDVVQANAIAREIAGGPFDLALTSSTPSLQALANANPSGRVRHVFAAVADPFSAGVGLDRADPRSHPRHLVGYGSLAPVDFTFGSRDGCIRGWPASVRSTIPPSPTRAGSWSWPGPAVGPGASSSSRPRWRTRRASWRR